MSMTTEPDLLDVIAEGYRARGYIVEREPLLEGEGGARLRVDLIARKPGENRIVEVKSPERRNAGRPPAVELSEWLKSHPDWHLDLVLAGGQDVDVTVAPLAGLETRIDRASSLLAANDVEAALLLAWAAFEGAARHALLAEGLSMPKPGGPLPLIQAIAHHGLVEPDDADRLRALLVKRNLVAHGGFAELSAGELALLVATARSLLNGPRPEATAPTAA